VEKGGEKGFSGGIMAKEEGRTGEENILLA